MRILPALALALLELRQTAGTASSVSGMYHALVHQMPRRYQPNQVLRIESVSHTPGQSVNTSTTITTIGIVLLSLPSNQISVCSSLSAVSLMIVAMSVRS
ncbi:MAG: hypothetical protein ACFHWZ_06240 [Phycisphaerales bacterium]